MKRINLEIFFQTIIGLVNTDSEDFYVLTKAELKIIRESFKRRGTETELGRLVSL